MSEQNVEQKNAAQSKRPNNLSKQAIIIVLFLMLCLLAWRLFFHDPDVDQLAELEASLSIPDSENAALFYNEFLTDPQNVTVLDTLSSSASASSYLPWTSSSNPVSADLIKNNDLTIQKIIDISKIKEARFSIEYDAYINNNISIYLRKITFILSWIGANDIGDGRLDKALETFEAQTRIACHLNQQPGTTYKNMGVALESVALKNIQSLAMTENITKEQLLSLDKIVTETQNYIGQDKELEDKVERLIYQKQKSQVPIYLRPIVWVTNFFVIKPDETKMQQYLIKRISIQRACRILIAIHLYQKQNSKWPDSLSQIESYLPMENFTDEINKGAFVYKITGDGFILYSKGQNNIDDNHKADSDDVIFWSKPDSQK